MTDKENIIIDGVDVGGYDYHYIDNDGKHRCFEYDQTCDCTANCSYGAICLKEQFQRKEQLLIQAENHIKDLDLMVHNGECRENELEQKLYAKEQECEQWKQKYYSSTTEVKEDLIKQNRTLKQECEKIKELIDACNVKDINALEDAFLKFEENFIMADSECEKLKAKNKELKEENKYLQGRVKGEIHLGNKYKQDFAEQVTIANRYKQALEKIDSIVSEIDLTIIGGEKSPKEEWISLYIITCARILNIINEVKNADI